MSPTKQITELSAEEEQRLFDHIRSWDRAWLDTSPVDYKAVDAALLRLAEYVLMEKPQVVWCASPRQMIRMMVLYDVLTSEIDESQSRDLLTHFGTTAVPEILCLELDALGNTEWTEAYTALLKQFTQGKSKPLEIGVVDTTNDHRRLTDRIKQLNRQIKLSIAPELRESIDQTEILASRDSLQSRVATHVGATGCLNEALGIKAGGAAGLLLQSMFENRSGALFERQTDLWSETVTPVVTRLKCFHILLKGIRRDSIDLTKVRNVLQPINWHYFKLWQITSALTVWQQSFYNVRQKQFAEDWQTAMHGAFSYHFGDGVIFACKKPVFVSTDERFRLHNEEDPAVEFLDGFKLFAWHGITIAEEIWTNFDKVTPETITHERNLERRRALIEKYGTARYLTAAGAALVSSDECGELFRMELKGDEPIVMVRVTNSTPDPDGSFKQYFLRVPPDTQTARGGIAWTFGVNEEEYDPKVQT